MEIIVAIELILSWGLLYLFCKQSLIALGINPITKRLFQVIIGFVIFGVLSTCIQLLDSSMTKTSLTLNSDVSLGLILQLLWSDSLSVLFEELLFRGALLYIAIQKLGAKEGLLLSSIGFGIYHWFTYGVLGNFPMMLFVLVMTAIPGFMFAYAFLKTKSIALPIGMHLGWNFTTVSIFSEGSWHREGILLPQKIEDVQYVVGIPMNDLINIFLSNLFVPILTILVIKLYYMRKNNGNSYSTTM
jgi:uncharacterized protein